MSLRQQILHNFWLKLFSAVLAGLIWFIVYFDLQPTPGIGDDLFKAADEMVLTNITVAVLSSPADPRRFTIQPAVVDLVVKGRGSAARGVNSAEVRVFVDLRGFKQADPAEPVLVNQLSGGAAYSLRVIPPVVTVHELKN